MRSSYKGLFLILALCVVSGVASPNVILILADDLGYGDLGWAPFSSNEMEKVRSPNLQRMAKNGMILTNFHAASPICSPSRAAIMTGLYPWRMGVDFIYSQDPKKDGTEELDHEQLPLIPNIAMAFQHYDYYTAHLGKWHLGGISQFDIPNRKNGNCTVPGINQYGFDEYVAMTEHMFSARYWTQQRQETYAKGANFLFRNDEALPSVPNPPILTDKQTTEAIRVIKEQSSKGKPFFVNLWYDAPHSPWEAIQPYYNEYRNHFQTDRLTKYASMITNMDMNIGRLLDVLDDLQISENTFVIFTSDNGPEEGAGSPGPFKGRKRYLNEGGIRVPTIVQWKGKIKANSKSDRFAVNTDLFPTFMDVIGKPMPSTVRVDGISMLPMLLESNMNDNILKKVGDERVVQWYTHCLDYPKFSAAWSHGYKVIWYDYEGRKSKNLPSPWRVFNMQLDPLETNNLFPLLANNCKDLDMQSSATNSSVINWKKINSKTTLSEKSQDEKLEILKLIRYLQMEMYLFRFDGEFDWLLYHDNRPAETGSHCRTRKIYETQSLPWSSNILLPKFCGKGLLSENSFGCSCDFATCSAGWHSAESTWTHATFHGITHFAPMKGSQQNYVKSILQWTNFQDICSNSQLVAVSDANSRSSEKVVDQNNHFSCEHKHGTVAQNGLLPENKQSDHTSTILENMGYSRGNFIGNDWKRSCHARVHYNEAIQQYYLTTSTCAYDKPVMILNAHGIPRPVPICPESFQHLMNAEKTKNYVDDGLFLPLSYLSILSKNSEFKEMHQKQLKLHRDTAIIDPLFLHFLSDDDKVFSYQTKIEDLFQQYSLPHKINQLWGFILDYQDRLRPDCSNDCISYLLIPAFWKGYWSIGVLSNIRDKHGPKLVFYKPTGFHDEGKNSKIYGQYLGEVMRVLASTILSKTSHDESFSKLQVELVEPVDTLPSPAMETFKLLLFVRNYLDELRNPSLWGKSSASSITGSIKKEDAANFRKKIMSFIVHEGKTNFQQRKTYITKMSEERFGK